MPQTPKVNTVGIWMSSVWNLMCSRCFFVMCLMRGCILSDHLLAANLVFFCFCLIHPDLMIWFLYAIPKQQGIPLISTTLKFVKYYSYSVPPDLKMCQECHPCVWLLLSKLGCVFLYKGTFLKSRFSMLLKFVLLSQWQCWGWNIFIFSKKHRVSTVFQGVNGLVRYCITFPPNFHLFCLT